MSMPHPRRTSRPYRIRRWAAYLIAASLLTTAGATLTTPAMAKAASCGSTFERSLDFRQTFGLSTDADLIRRLQDDPAANCTWGVPLTSEEAAGIDRRNAVELYLGDLTRLVDRHDDAFGGLYIDQRAGGTVVLLTTPSTTQALIDEALSVIPPDAPDWFEVVTREVKYSQLRLTEMMDEIKALIAADSRVAGIVGYGPSVIENRVEVGILEPRFAAVRDFLLERYPEDLLAFVARRSGDSAVCGWCDEEPPRTDVAMSPAMPSVALAALAAAFGAVFVVGVLLGPRRRRSGASTPHP